MLLGLQKDGISFHETQWFCYDRDHVTDQLDGVLYVFRGPQKCDCSRTGCIFRCWASSGFNPSIFEANEDERPIWGSHPAWGAAWVRYWYRKFYTETVTGQLMMLRPDEPTLYHYERPQRRERFRDVEFVCE